LEYVQKLKSRAANVIERRRDKSASIGSSGDMISSDSSSEYSSSEYISSKNPSDVISPVTTLQQIKSNQSISDIISQKSALLKIISQFHKKTIHDSNFQRHIKTVRKSSVSSLKPVNQIVEQITHALEGMNVKFIRTHLYLFECRSEDVEFTIEICKLDGTLINILEIRKVSKWKLWRFKKIQYLLKTTLNL
jgi:hypothetical protein